MCKISKETLEKCNKLAKLFNAKTGAIEKTACTGKYRGTFDYSVVFDNGTSFFISNGLKYFNSRIDDLIKTYENFNQIENKNKILNYLKKECELDKTEAVKQGLNAYKIIDVDYSKKNNSYLGWFYVTIQLDNGDIVDMIETGLNANIIRLVNSKELIRNRRQNYFVAGGLKDNEANYVFHNVGFNSRNNMYKLEKVA